MLVKRRKNPFCDYCGKPIGPDRGPGAKTCSLECQRDRHNAREKVRYLRVKDTLDWKAVRADYLDRLRARLAADPEFAQRQAQAHRAAVKRHYDRLTPKQLDEYRAARRDWHRNLAPERRAARKPWYASLSPELKSLFLAELREKRALARLQDTTTLGGPRGVPWADDEIALLGTDTDRAIAARLGRSIASVKLQRDRHGIPAAFRTGKRLVPGAVPSVIRPNDTMRELLGELEPLLLLRYQSAGLPADHLEPWQIVEIALKELAAALRKERARERVREWHDLARRVVG